MPEQDTEASELDEAEEVLRVSLPSIGEPAVAEQPSKQALDLPAAHVAAQGAAILSASLAPVGLVRSDQLDPSFFAKPRVERIAVISSVSNKAIGCVLEKAGVDGRFDERGFMRRSTCNPTGDRKTSAVCDGHDLRPLAPLGLSDGEAPFLAPAKVPSMKASVMSIRPRS
jgi:hypothetical protein